MSENTKVCVQVDLSDFAQNLQVGSLWGVDRLCKALEKVSEGNLEIWIPLRNGRNITLLFYGSRNESRHSVYEQAMNKTPSSQHCLTLEEFLEQYRLATPASQKTRSITP